MLCLLASVPFVRNVSQPLGADVLGIRVGGTAVLAVKCNVRISIYMTDNYPRGEGGMS